MCRTYQEIRFPLREYSVILRQYDEWRQGIDELIHSPAGGGGVSESDEVSIDGNTMRAHSVSLPDPSKRRRPHHE